jgi:predicted small secreted protein
MKKGVIAVFGLIALAVVLAGCETSGKAVAGAQPACSDSDGGERFEVRGTTVGRM